MFCSFFLSLLVGCCLLLPNLLLGCLRGLVRFLFIGELGLFVLWGRVLLGGLGFVCLFRRCNPLFLFLPLLFLFLLFVSLVALSLLARLHFVGPVEAGEGLGLVGCAGTGLVAVHQVLGVLL